MLLVRLSPWLRSVDMLAWTMRRGFLYRQCRGGVSERRMDNKACSPRSGARFGEPAPLLTRIASRAVFHAEGNLPCIPFHRPCDGFRAIADETPGPSVVHERILAIPASLLDVAFVIIALLLPSNHKPTGRLTITLR